MPYTRVSHSYGFSVVICCPLKCKFWQRVFPPLLRSKGFSLFKKMSIYLAAPGFRCGKGGLQSSIVACGIFSCNPRDLVPSSGIEPWLLPLWPWSLSHWTTGEAPEGFSWVWVLWYDVRIGLWQKGLPGMLLVVSSAVLSLFLTFERALACGLLCKFHERFLSCPSSLCLVIQSCPILCDPLDCSPPGSSVHGDSPGKGTGVGCHALLQGIFRTQGLNPGLRLCRKILYRLSCKGSRPPSKFSNAWLCTSCRDSSHVCSHGASFWY